VTSRSGEAPPRLFVFDTFGDDALSQAVSELDRGVDDRGVGRIGRHLGDERAVDLDLSDGQALEMGERLESRSELVEREADAEIA
jgi:hypothetical protein